jgi:hypothetical protein
LAACRDYADGIQAGLRFEPLLNDGFGLNLGFFTNIIQKPLPTTHGRNF